MDYGRKRARKYTFKIPKVEELEKLGKLVVNPQAFKEKYGKLLPLLSTNNVDGILATLVQFYDPTYHCFTFPDYQLISLTHSDIDWCSPDNDETKIIFSCGSYPNVPLIGTKGGISYNPTLARRQYGYPMKNIPSSIQLEGRFFKNIDDYGNMLKKEIVQARRLVHTKGRRLLGKHLCIFMDPYLQWVRIRAFKLRMPYLCQKPIPLRELIFLFSTDVEKLQAALNKVVARSRK